MTEQRPTYHADIAALAATRRQHLTDAALTDAGAAERALRALLAEVARLRDLLGAGTLDNDSLFAVQHALRDLRRCAEALGVGL